VRVQTHTYEVAFGSFASEFGARDFLSGLKCVVCLGVPFSGRGAKGGDSATGKGRDKGVTYVQADFDETHGFRNEGR
jgi:hypothetical protein